MALTFSRQERHQTNYSLNSALSTGMQIETGTITFDSSYPQGGESWTHVMDNPQFVLISPASGYSFEYDYTNDKVIAYQNMRAQRDITVQDSDGAASLGTAVYLHVDEVTEQGNALGHLETVAAGNADTLVQLEQGGPYIRIQDDDAAASSGTQLYFDEDASPAHARLLSVVSGDTNVLIFATDGSIVRVTDDDAAATNGVALYVDDDASNAYERLFFVSPTDADGTLQTYSGEVEDGEDLSGVTARYLVVGWP